MTRCEYCYCYAGEDEVEDNHESTPRHKSNVILFDYKHKKKSWRNNRDGLYVSCHITKNPLAGDGEPRPNVDRNVLKGKMLVNVLPNQLVNFDFDIKNETASVPFLIVGVHTGHPQPQYVVDYNPFEFGQEPFLLNPRAEVIGKIRVSFRVCHIGQYDMPLIFTFQRQDNQKNIILIREMVMNVTTSEVPRIKEPNPFKNEDWVHPKEFLPSSNQDTREKIFRVPKDLKVIFSRNLDERFLEREREEQAGRLQILIQDIKSILNESVTPENYIRYFHHLLWWEEVHAKICLKKYNMSKVLMEHRGKVYILEVPGLAEKRPSLLAGDRVVVCPSDEKEINMDGNISKVEKSVIHITDFDRRFQNEFYRVDREFDVKFLLNRYPLECKHQAVDSVLQKGHKCKIFPELNNKKIKVKKITKFFNNQIEHNEEQREAVQHILSNSSGLAPYIVFGPPGTGKTMTIVEAIVQLVVQNSNNRILVCANTNMAADHVALALLQYQGMLQVDNFLLRANSQNRIWEILPPELIPVSNGKCRDSHYPITNARVSTYKVVVTTLIHAAKFANASKRGHRVVMSHLFIDEAAQACEPSSLVPLSGLLDAHGALVLAGDCFQLGPICASRAASAKGLGISLLERLQLTFTRLYNTHSEDKYKYITKLVKNFRSDPDILEVPNDLFYDNELQAMAPLDPLSRVSLLGLPGGQRAAVFHGINSSEMKIGKSPSFFNNAELELVMEYVVQLVNEFNVDPGDIGVVTPYALQMFKLKQLLKEKDRPEEPRFAKIEVGTVEAFQGKEKRVILISAVRGNSKLLDYDAKYQLGFLVCRKRFNVALTRAKAKLVVIGNPTVLTTDARWNSYMEWCKRIDSYHGTDWEQMERTTALLTDITNNFRAFKVQNAIEEERQRNNRRN